MLVIAILFGALGRRMIHVFINSGPATGSNSA